MKEEEPRVYHIMEKLKKELQENADSDVSKKLENWAQLFLNYYYVLDYYDGMATVFLTNFIRCRTSFRMLFRLSLTMSLLGCDDLRQELTVKVRLPR
ncbi:hypothetical protein NI447_08735 [Enterococcus lactis]|nr:hypothetical protein [Enterococcus lactis]